MGAAVPYPLVTVLIFRTSNNVELPVSWLVTDPRVNQRAMPLPFFEVQKKVNFTKKGWILEEKDLALP